MSFFFRTDVNLFFFFDCFDDQMLIYRFFSDMSDNQVSKYTNFLDFFENRHQFTSFIYFFRTDVNLHLFLTFLYLNVKLHTFPWYFWWSDVKIHIVHDFSFFYDQISTHIFFISLLSLSDVKLNLFFSNFSQTYVKLHLISWFFLDKMINHIFCLIFQDYMLFHTLFLCQLLTRSVIQLLLDFPHNQNLFFNYW